MFSMSNIIEKVITMACLDEGWKTFDIKFAKRSENKDFRIKVEWF